MAVAAIAQYFVHRLSRLWLASSADGLLHRAAYTSDPAGVPLLGHHHCTDLQEDVELLECSDYIEEQSYIQLATISRVTFEAEIHFFQANLDEYLVCFETAQLSVRHHPTFPIRMRVSLEHFPCMKRLSSFIRSASGEATIEKEWIRDSRPQILSNLT
jgi:hypothetical protein